MNILQTLGTLFLTPLEAEARTFAGDIVTWAKAEETAVVDDVKIALAALGPVLRLAGPAEWAILDGLVATARSDVQNGDYGNLVTDVLNQAAAKELAWVAGLGTAALTVILAALHLQKAGA